MKPGFQKVSRAIFKSPAVEKDQVGTWKMERAKHPKTKDRTHQFIKRKIDPADVLREIDNSSSAGDLRKNSRDKKYSMGIGSLRMMGSRK